ncbi:cadherin-13 isoform X3, partial [Sigmodon hispidus]
NPPATGTGTLLITLEDVNDNAPFIYPTVAEVCDDAKNLSVVILGATDKDLHPNTDPFKFEIHKQTIPDKVWKISKINNTHALVSLLQNLNKANYNLPIMVTDSGKPPMTNITDLRVQVCSCKNSKVDCNALISIQKTEGWLILQSVRMPRLKLDSQVAIATGKRKKKVYPNLKIAVYSSQTSQPGLNCSTFSFFFAISFNPYLTI